jgi:hypothetical protein
MEDTTDEKKIDNPLNIQSDIIPGEIASTNDLNANAQNKETEIMEVHKHPHHITHKKKFGEYFLEFLMLFLAVFLGFLAENIREHKVEREREKVLIVSMIKELESDNEKINGVYQDSIQNNMLDSLVIALTNTDNNEANIKRAYVLKNNLASFPSITFNRSTLSQLKNGGYMRLITNPEVVENLNLIDNSIDYLKVQGDIYEKFFLSNLQFSSKIFDVRYRINFNNAKNKTSYDDFINQQPNIKYLSDDEKLRIEFASQILFRKSIVGNYLYMLKQHQEFSMKIVEFLKKEYHIE